VGFVKSALRGSQGEHRYFTSAFAWGELDQMAVLPEELPELDDDQQMQRMLAKKRITELSEYLTRTQNHFFSALTLIILPRDLSSEAEEGADYSFSPDEDVSNGLGDTGVLELSGRVRLLPADGQHRLRGAMEAMKRRPSLADETVPVVLLPYRDTQQVRQLFADLNLNAKPVNKTVGYAYDSRDPSVQVAKLVMEKVELFSGRVNQKSNSLPRTSAQVITLNVLVEGTRMLLDAMGHGKARDLGEAVAAECAQHWTSIIAPFRRLEDGAGWTSVLEGVPAAAGALRDQYVFPHGMGWKALAKAAAALMRENVDWVAAYEAGVGRINWDRDDLRWQGLAMSQGRVNNTDSSVDAIAKLIVRASLGEGDDSMPLLPAQGVAQ
jgi:DGQHR domain-containing protein